MRPGVAPPSIRGRLQRVLLLWALLFGVALTVSVWLAVRDEVDELLDDTLKSAAEGLLAPLARDGRLAGAASDPLATGSGQRFVWQWVAYSGAARVLRSSPGAPAQALQGTPSPGFGDAAGWRVYGIALGQDGEMLYVAQARVERREALGEIGLAVLLAGLPMGLLALLWLGAGVRHELAPLQSLSERLEGHDPLAAGATLGPASREELRPVHEAIDALAGRLARRVAQERAFAGHAAHALRTPLAGIDAQLAMALREAGAAQQPRLLRVRGAAVRLQRVVAGLLALFRSGVEVQRLPLDLRALAARLPVEGLALQVEADAPLQGDADLLTAALLNLLDNAQRHGAAQVRLSTPAAQCLRVHDDGSGIAPERMQALQQALDAQDYEGRTGLGLMLADLVARAHGGRLRLDTAPGAPGLGIDIELGPWPGTH